MALKRGIRQLKNAEHCARKVRHDTRAAAKAALRKQSGAAEHPDTLRVYRCAACNGWHLGRPAG